MSNRHDTGVPLLESKLHAPRRRRGVVTRPRLAARFDRANLPAVVLVSAPAGFGKTTLLTEWIAGQGSAPTAWLSLDRRDNDPAVFWTYVVNALRAIDAGIGVESLTTLQSTPSALDVVVTSLLNDISAVVDDVVLVLDDYHVIETVELHESMRFLLEHLPANLHLVIASRADPPLSLATLRARGELGEVRAADLRFTSDEAATYLHDAMGLELVATDVDTLEARTEGWIAALQLAALSLQGRDDPTAFIAEFAGDDRFVVDYLVDEVLDRQSPDVRAFLLDTSILSRMTAALCDAVTGRTDARATLEALERSNLFLVALDDRRRWYRYHHLFADVLRSRLADEDPSRLPELHRRASAWFAANGDADEAIRHAMAAQDFAKAAELIELAIPGWRQSRQDATLRAAVDSLPRDVFENRPVLTLGLVGAHMNAGDVAGIDELLDTIEAVVVPAQPSGGMIVFDHAELRRLPAQAAIYRAGLALLRGDLEETVAQGSRAADLSDVDDHFERGAAGALIGLAHWTEGDLEAAARDYAAAIAAFERAEFLPDILGCSLGLADIQFAQGDLDAAEGTLTAGLALADADAPLRGSADMHVGLAELHLERNRLDAAADHLRISLELGDRAAGAQHPYRWRVVDARLRAAHGDFDTALRLLREAERLYNTDYSPSVRPVTATTARVQLAAGDLDGALRWAASAGVAAHDDPTYLREYEHLTLARVLAANGHTDDALRLLARLLVAADNGGRNGSAVETGVLLALAHQANGATTEALSYLGDALARAEATRFVRVFLEAGTPMTALLQAAVRLDRAADQATRLLAAGSRSSAAPAQGLVDELSSRELDVLRLLRTDLSGPQIAAELVVSLNTVRTHTKNIFMKLGVNSRRAAVRRADELGL